MCLLNENVHIDLKGAYNLKDAYLMKNVSIDQIPLGAWTFDFKSHFISLI